MKKLFYEVFCMLGIHLKREKLIVIAIDADTGKNVELYYDVCPNCGDGNPYATGEF